MLSRSDSTRQKAVGFFALTFVALIAAASPVLSSLVTTNIFVVSDDQTINEDVYVTSTKGIVDGTINGDLTIFTGDLVIRGSVNGSVHVISSGTVTVTEGGTIAGSLQGVAANVAILGNVGSDLFVTAASIVIEEPGTIARDAIAFGGVLRVEGTVGRDVRGRTVRTVIDGSVGGDIDVATQKFEVGSPAVVGGDVQYRSRVDGSISPGAQISGSVKRLPTQSNFIYGVVLAMANLVGFLAFVVAGIVAIVVARSSGSRAAGAVITNPIKTLLWGLGAVIATPVAALVLAATLVGLPLALLLVMVMIAGLIIGPVPVITALGNRVLLKRGGLIGAFVAGAVLWRFAIWLVPLVGGALFILALVWGVGAWIVGILAARNADPISTALLPASLIPKSDVPVDWEPPLSPLGREPEAMDDEIDDDADRTMPEPDDDGDIALMVNIVATSEQPPPLVSEEETSEPSEDDGVEARRAEFEALLKSATEDSNDPSDDDPQDDEWGLPTS